MVQDRADRSGLSGGGIVIFVIAITIFSSALAQPTSWFGGPDLASILLGLWELRNGNGPDRNRDRPEVAAIGRQCGNYRHRSTRLHCPRRLAVMARSVKTNDAPAMLPGGLLALSERLRHNAKAIHGDQKFAADLKHSALAIRRLACIVMLDESKVDLNLDRRERIERDVIAIWLSCI